MAAVGVCTAIVQAGLVRPVVAWLGERAVLLLGLFCGAGAFALYGFADSGILFWVGIPIMAVWGLADPTTQALMTPHVGPDEQGQLQGAMSALRGIAGMIGPKLFTLTFAAFIGRGSTGFLPGAPFLLSAVLVLLAMGLAFWATRDRGEVAHPAGEGVQPDEQSAL